MYVCTLVNEETNILALVVLFWLYHLRPQIRESPEVPCFQHLKSFDILTAKTALTPHSSLHSLNKTSSTPKSSPRILHHHRLPCHTSSSSPPAKNHHFFRNQGRASQLRTLHATPFSMPDLFALPQHTRPSLMISQKRSQ